MRHRRLLGCLKELRPIIPIRGKEREKMDKENMVS